MHGLEEFSRGLLRRRRRARSTACSAARARAGRSPWTSCPSSAAPSLWHRGAFLQRRLERPARRRPRRRARPDGGRRGGSAAGHASGAVAGHPVPARTPASASGPRRRSTRSSLATTEQAVFDLVADALADDLAHRRRSRRPAVAVRVPVLAGGDDLRRHREIQRNIIARRLLDLGIRPVMDARRARAVRAQPAPRCDAGTAARRSTPPSTSWAGATRWPPIPRTAVSTLFELQGAANATLVRPRRRARPPPSASKADGPVAVVLPPLGRVDAPAVGTGTASSAARSVGAAVAVVGRPAATGSRASLAVARPDRPVSGRGPRSATSASSR